MDRGNSSQRVQRVMSAQKLPTWLDRRVAKPRMSANTTAMPVAADRKFCTVSASIWVR